MSAFREAAKKILPASALDWYRRRRAKHQYLDALSRDLLQRDSELDYVEGRVAQHRTGLEQRLAREVLERTEIVLGKLDRRIEAVSARSGEQLQELRRELAELQREIAELRAATRLPSAGGIQQPAGPSEAAATAARE